MNEPYISEDAILTQELNERLQKKVRRRTVLIWIVGAFIVLLILAGLAFLMMKLFFSVKQVAVKGSDKYAAEQLLSASGIGRGDMLLFIGKKGATEAILNTYPEIESVQIERALPDRLIFTIKEETPLFCFENSDATVSGAKGTSFAVVTESQKLLKVFESLEDARAAYGELPLVRMPQLAYAVEGKTIRYKEVGDSDYIPQLLKTLCSSVFMNENLILDARTRFDIVVYSGIASDGGAKYELRLGNKKYGDIKISLAQNIVTDKLEKSFVGVIDVSTNGDEEVKQAYARARL